tara:strand:+ start:5584 stop:6384 length:801 start_codon:yes stop_codon:yes gene_type:complete
MQYPIAFMVAGLSSRFKGKIKAFTEIGPNQESLIELSIDRAIKAGFNKIIFIVGTKTQQSFKEFFKENYSGVPVEYTLQYYNKETRDKPWGTTDAICSASNIINGPVLVCSGDDLYSEQTYITLFNHMKTKETDATLGYTLDEHLPQEGEVNRGVFYIEDNYVRSSDEILRISRSNITEKGVTLNTPCSISIFLIQKETLNKLKNIIDKFKEENKDSRTKECYLNVEIGNLTRSGETKMRYYPGEGRMIGITNPEDEGEARELLKR